jgi:putative endonuclease
MLTDYQSRYPDICAAYVLANPSRSIYVGATRELDRRIYQHQTHFFAGSHTDKYNINRLVWFERHDDWDRAHAREIEIKGLGREKKVELIQPNNPKWQDLSYGLFHWSSSRLR